MAKPVMINRAVAELVVDVLEENYRTGKREPAGLGGGFASQVRDVFGMPEQPAMKYKQDQAPQSPPHKYYQQADELLREVMQGLDARLGPDPAENRIGASFPTALDRHIKKMIVARSYLARAYEVDQQDYPEVHP